MRGLRRQFTPINARSRGWCLWMRAHQLLSRAVSPDQDGRIELPPSDLAGPYARFPKSRLCPQTSIRSICSRNHEFSLRTSVHLLAIFESVAVANHRATLPCSLSSGCSEQKPSDTARSFGRMAFFNLKRQSTCQAAASFAPCFRDRLDDSLLCRSSFLGCISSRYVRYSEQHLFA